MKHITVEPYYNIALVQYWSGVLKHILVEPYYNIALVQYWSGVLKHILVEPYYNIALVQYWSGVLKHILVEGNHLGDERVGDSHLGCGRSWVQTTDCKMCYCCLSAKLEAFRSESLESVSVQLERYICLWTVVATTQAL